MTIAAAGPYQLRGWGLAAACAAAGNGTDYLDLSGEIAWMGKMIDTHAALAERTGARILIWYDLLFSGRASDGRDIRVLESSDRDPA